MYLLFDIGGTNMRLAASEDGKKFGEPMVIPTPHNYDRALEKFFSTARTLSAGKRIIAAAGGVAGPFDAEHKKFISFPNLPEWSDKPLIKDLEKGLGAHVFFENDSAIVGLGEATVGAGKGFGIVAYLTVSTGVGGARIVNGHIDEHRMSFEPGKQVIDPDQSLVTDAGGSTLEHYISGRWVEKRTGKKPYEITDEAFWDRLAYFLALGLNNTLTHWAPDVVVLGGSMMKEIGIPISAVEKHLKQICTVYPQLPPIKKATLGDFGGLHGALAYLNQYLK